MARNSIRLTNRNAFNKSLEAAKNRLDEAMYLILRRAALQFVTAARTKTKKQGGFDDQSGNLRSSIGYIIMKDGSILDQNFTGAAEGKNKGLSFAKSFSSSPGYSLIVVAGMEYAAALESRGIDVITGSAMVIEGDLKAALKKVMAKQSF